MQKFWFGVLIVAVYLVTLVLYRLFHSPLSKIPGPRLAGMKTETEGNDSR